MQVSVGTKNTLGKALSLRHGYSLTKVDFYHEYDLNRPLYTQTPRLISRILISNINE
jgi:hypothetical protein